MTAQRLFVLLFCSLLFALPGSAQTSWRKNVKEGDELLSKGLYEEAGARYYAAWERKTKKRELAYQAGEAFSKAKAYTQAAKAYEQALEKSKSFPLVGLKYARALKQSGRYGEASKAFSNFIGAYQGTDLDEMVPIVANEIRGCELAANPPGKDQPSGVKLVHLSDLINSRATEFAPIPFNEEILYFSSTKDGRAQIYRAENTDGEWSQSALLTNFPEIEKDHFCNGALTPDNKRFYFTICQTLEKKGEPVSRCEIYVTKRQGNSWSQPERLRDYINLAEATTTHPYVIFNGTTEILYFASDRAGGFGGMDIWYVTRDINSKDFDFTYPVNCGSPVNTALDEVTPYYDLEEATLYFSSNGHLSLGGLDIQMASGSRSQWKTVENLGAPFNSGADDYYFVRSPSKRMGFFASNRISGPEKPTTTDEDIFQFFYELTGLVENYPLVTGFVYDQMTGEALTQVTVEVYELAGPDEKFLAGREVFENGSYSFTLLNDRQYELIASKPGYETGSITLSTSGPRPSEKGYSTPIFLKNIGQPAPTPRPREQEVKPAPEPPAPSATAYRVQVSAVRNYDAARFSALENIGDVITEKIQGRGLTRVMVGDFPTMDAALNAQNQVEAKGFSGTIIVLYEAGKRIRTFE
jgi:tetratricopeptide (TPR) repeat protein